MNPNLLLVEGGEEQRLIPQFMDEYVIWGETKATSVVLINEFGGIENLLKPGTIESQIKSSGVRRVGIIVDANDHIEDRWRQVKDRCRRVLEDFPDDLPDTGLLYESKFGVRVGVWIMPDNRSPGMLETFLGYLLKPEMATVWTFAQEACESAKGHGAPFSESHRHKANIHTYLAWMEKPGLQLHVAVIARAIDARSPIGRHFVDWFMNLYELPPRAEPLDRPNSGA